MKKIRIGWIVVSVALILALTGCSLIEKGGWVAKVNGEEVTLTDFNTRLGNAQQVYKAQGMDFSTEQGAIYLPRLKADILNTIIEARYIAQEVKRLDLDVNDAKAKEELDNIKAQFGGDEAAFHEVLNGQGILEEELINITVLYADIIKDISIEDSDVQAYFELNKKRYDQVQAKHILVDTEETAIEIIARLDQGENFEQLAQELSLDGSKEQGGELGYFLMTDMVAEFANAAFSQEVGTYSQTPVQTQYGYHIILVEDYKDASLDEIKETVAADARMEAQATKFEEYLANLKESAQVEYAKGYEPGA
jgi:peptidyl-prolyl cis-trans isomerase C